MSERGDRPSPRGATEPSVDWPGAISTPVLNTSGLETLRRYGT